jgi:CheY-like chemotaxis protein
MMTAFGSPSVRQEAFRNGVIAYLEKPFDLRVLKQELRRTLEMRAQQPASYDLIDITQAINVGRRDVVAQVAAGGLTGQLAFERGDLVSAEFGELRGDEAFQAMCLATAQRIWQAPPATAPERNVTKPVSALIFDALLARNTPPGGTDALSLPPSATPRYMTPQPAPPSGLEALTSGTGGLMAPLEARVADAQRTLAGLVVTIGLPCAVALLTPAGAMRAVAQTAQPPLSEAVLAYVAQVMQATARAARAGQWGAVREARLLMGERQALVRLLNPAGDALALVVVAPATMDARQLDAAVATHEGALRSLAL